MTRSGILCELLSPLNWRRHGQLAKLARSSRHHPQQQNQQQYLISSDLRAEKKTLAAINELMSNDQLNENN